MAGRPRKPTRVLELQGAFRKDPQRKRAREGEPQVTEPLGDPPDCLDEAVRARWREIAAWCPWLMAPDRVLVEVTAVLWAEFRRGAANASQTMQLSRNLTHLGMSPSDRSKVKVPPAPRTKNPFEELQA